METESKSAYSALSPGDRLPLLTAIIKGLNFKCEQDKEIAFLIL
jgi:hypothetical protein